MKQELHLPVFHDTLEDVPPPCATTDLIGHHASLDLAARAALSGHHAVIFQGARGIGKASAAFVLANHLLGDNQTQQLSTQRDATDATWRQIAQNSHPNLFYMSRPWDQTSKKFKTVITVEEVRRLHHFTSLTAGGSGARLIIIDSIDDLHRSAANALLKLLEEPPKNTWFLLISHAGRQVLPTIRSRCQMVRFHPLSAPDLAQVLQNIGFQSDDQALTVATRYAQGSVREAVQMLLLGGGELKLAIDRVLAAPDLDVETAHKLAEIASARGNAQQLAMLNKLMHDNIRQRALELLRLGATAQSAQLCELDSNIRHERATASAFGLDVKQQFLLELRKIHAATQALL